MARAIVLVDGNNFYASCEAAFDPAVIGRPLVVLSNNDGCIVSRSQEARALGIAMGQPYFQVRRDLERLVEVLRIKGVKVVLISTDGMVPRELRNAADRFVDLAELRAQLEKNEAPLANAGRS